MENIKEKRDLLVIEDDEGLQRQLRWAFPDYNVIIAKNREEAVAAIRRHRAPVVTLDLGLPPDPANVSEGFATLEELLSLSSDTKIIVITGNDDRDNAVKAIACGAYDFYQKPIDPEIIQIILDRAFKLHELENAHRSLLRKSGQSSLDGLITASESMLKVCRTIEKIAPTNTTALLIGESGTGKEILAKALHELSSRSENRFVAINCAAIPDSLLESELFGYEKGAFTGANKQTKGKIEMAEGGTLFLDELGDLPLSLQAKLLRFLQERVIERLGGREEIPIDVRVVSATHYNLKELVAEGKFREDLFYRLSEITINIPPLRERDSDSILLARTFLERYAAEMDSVARNYSKDSLKAIENYNWPGNIRELENKIKRAVVMAESPIITLEELDLHETESSGMPFNLRDVREKCEKEAISRALQHVDNNISKGGEQLGVSRPTLYDLLNKYELK